MSRADRRRRWAAALAVFVVAGCQVVLGIDAREAATRGDDAADAAAVDAAVETPGDAGGADVTVCRIGEDRCGGACVDLRTSPNHCGECGRSCLGARCTGGTCEPELVVPDAGGGSVWLVGSELWYRWDDDGPVMSTLLARDRKTNAARAIGEIGHWTTLTPTTSSAWLLLEHVPNPRLRLVDPVVGLGAVVYAQPTETPPFRGANVEGDDVFWSTRKDVRHVKLDGSGYEVVHTVTRHDAGASMGILATPTTVFFGVEDTFEIMTVPRAGDRQVTAFDRGDGNVVWMGLRGDTLFWAGGRQIRAVSLTTKAVETYPLGNIAQAAIARDDVLYVADVAHHPGTLPDPRASRVVRLDLATRRRTVIADGLPVLGQIAVDDRYVYLPYADGGIYRVPR